MAVKTNDCVVEYFEDCLEVTANKKNTAIKIAGMTYQQAENAKYTIENGQLVITFDDKTLKISNYEKIKYIKTDYEKIGKKETYNLFDIITNSVVDNTANIINSYNAKKLTVTGTNYNDKIDLSESNYEPTGKTNIKKNKGITFYGGNGNDILIGTDYNDVFKGGNGEDEITGGIGSDTITGGSGTTIVNYSKGDGDDVINLTKGEKFTLKLSNLSLSDLKFEYVKKDLKISYEINGEKGSITLKNFASKDVINNSNIKKGITDESYVEIKIGDEIYDLRSNQKNNEYWYKIEPKGNFTGGWLNDHINAQNAPEIIKKGKHVDITLKGGNGDDLIESSMYADKIYGNSGLNTIKYSNLEQLSGDKIYLTKGEQLNIDVSKIENANATYKVVKNDLIVTVSNGTDTKEFTIINFGTKDVTNNKTKKSADNSYVNLITSNDTIDLRKEAEVYSSNGTYHNDIITQSLYENKKNKGLTIKGRAGNDTITGSNYGDKIYGNTDNDTINAGTGNNSIFFNKGDGHDIIENGNGVDTIVFAKKTAIEYSYNQYDLIIKYSNNDSVTLKDYIKGHSVQYIKIGNKTTDFNPPMPEVSITKDNENNTTIFNGTVLNDTINATSTNTSNIIYANDGDDTIISSYNNDTIDGGNGDDTYLFSGECQHDTILNGSGQDCIKFEQVQDIKYCRYINQNDLIIKYGYNSSITLKDYFVNNSHSTKTILNGENILNITDEVSKGCCYIAKGGDEIIQDYKATDSIKLEGYYSLSYSRLLGSDDLIISYGKNTITLKDYFISDNKINNVIDRYSNINLSEDLLNGYSIIGTGNSDIFESVEDFPLSYVVNGGNDVIQNYKSTDTIKFETKTDLSYSKINNSDDLIITYGENTITIKDYFKNNEPIEKIINGNTNLDIKKTISNKLEIIFSAEDTEFEGTKNNDVIHLKDKGITYNVSDGSGNDILYSGTNEDTISFTDKTFENLSYEKQDNDLIIKHSENDSVILKDYFTENHSVKYISADGVTSLLKDKILIKIEGTYSADSIVGTDYSDSIVGGYGDDIIYGGDGDDTIRGYYGSDILNGGAGNNIFEYHYGDSASDQDVIEKSTGNDTIKFTYTPFYMHFSRTIGENDLILNYGERGSSATITLKDYYVNEPHSVKNIQIESAIYSIENAINKYGIKITGTDNGENIIGSNANDTIYSVAGNDTIQAGTGKDEIHCGTNSSNIIFNIGDGADTIFSGTSEDTIEIKNVNIEDFTYTKKGNDLIIAYTDNDNITLKDYFKKEHSAKKIKIGNKTYLLNEKINNLNIEGTNSAETITGTSYNDVIYSKQGNDTIDGGAGNDTYIFNNGDGTDRILAGSGSDKVVINSSSPISLVGNLSSKDFTIYYGSSGIILENYYNNTNSVKTIKLNEEEKSISDFIDTYGIKLIGSDGNDSIKGTSKNDEISTGAGNDIINAGKGDDNITLETGKNTLIFNTDDGSDIVIGGSTTDTLTFNNYSIDNLSWEKSDSNLIIKYGESFADTITLQDFFSKQNNNKVLTDYLSNTSSILDKAIINVSASSGGTFLNDIYSVTEADNNAIITNNGGNDTLYFENTNLADLVYKISNNDVMVGYNKVDDSVTNWITIKDCASDNEHSLKYIKSKDLQTINLNDIVITEGFNVVDNCVIGTKYADRIVANGEITSINAGKGNDTITSNASYTTYIFNSGDGNDVITSLNANDTIEFTGDSFSFDSLIWEKSNEDLIIKYTENDSITLKDYFINGYDIKLKDSVNDVESSILNKFYYNPSNVEVQDGTMNGSEIDFQRELDSDGDGLAGPFVSIKEELYGPIGGNSQTYQYKYYISLAGAGLETNNNYFGIFYDSHPTYFTLNVTAESDKNEHIRYGYYGVADLERDIELKKYFEFEKVAIIGDNTNNLLIGEKDINIIGGKGDDYLYGGNGSKFEFNTGDGNDVLYTSNSLDELVFCDDYKITLEQSNNDLIIKYNNDSDSILVENYYANDSRINIAFKASQEKDNEITGYDFSEIIYTGEKNDVVNTFTGDDTIYSFAGSDTLNGGLGDDIYYIEDLYRRVELFDESGNNDTIILDKHNKSDIILRFDMQIDAEGNIIEDSSKNMYIMNDNQFDVENWGVIITNQFVEGNSIEKIQTADGYYITTTELNELRTNIASWLKANNFESVEDVINPENTTAIENLYAQFQNATWQQIQ